MSSTIPALQPKYLLGLETRIKGNVHYLDSDDILYPVGGVLVIHNFAQKHQKYVRLPEKGTHVNLICVGPNYRVVAIAERGDPPSISIYDLVTLKRRKQFTVPAEKLCQAKSFECMSFTCDGRTLIAVAGDPDWNMYCFKWERGKVENSAKVNNFNGTGTVNQVACNPNDAGLVVVVGDTVFKLMAVSDNIWRQYGYNKSEQINFTSVAWLAQDRLATGTADGRILIIENGELKNVYWAEEVTVITLKSKDDVEEQSSVTALLETKCSVLSEHDREVRCITTFEKGFIFTYGTGLVHFFEKSNPNKYTKRNVFKLCSDSILQEDKKDSNRIKQITVNQMQEYIVVSSDLPQLYTAFLWGLDISRQPETKFKELGPALHQGAIYKMACCYWKPIILTAGKDDRTLRIWNYETQNQILTKRYQEDIYGVDLHPNGLYAIVGFAGKLRFMTILIDDFMVTREFGIRYCNECQFSSLGHLFAAVNGNVIQVYTVAGFENIVNLKGHNGRVTSLVWSQNDYVMYSCGTEGAFYEWDLSTGRRTTEVIIKSCKFTGCRAHKDGKVAYGVGQDGEIKEIINGVVRTAQHLEPSGLDCLALSMSNLMLFVSGRNGSVFSIKLPLGVEPEFLEFNIHNNTVTTMHFSYDDAYVLTCSVDGSICVWKVINAVGKMKKMDKDFIPSSDILIPYEDLAEKINAIRDLTMRMGELDTEYEYQTRVMETNHNVKMKEVHRAYCEVIEELKEKNTNLEIEHIQEIHQMTMDMNEMKTNHEKAMQDLEAVYNEKLIFEYQKYLELEDKLARVRKEYDKELEDLALLKKDCEAKIIEEYTEKLKEKDFNMEELNEKIRQNQKEHEIIKQQIEDDADREIFELKKSHESELKEEQNTNVKLRAENGIYCKKINSYMKDIDELKHKIFSMENEHNKFKNVIADLEKTINEYKKEVNERDITLQEKEKRIHDLKKRNQELEKYKLVLEYQIGDLKAQIEPRERKIHDQKEQIEDMIKELENLQKTVESLKLQLTELREKLSASHRQFRLEQARYSQANDLLRAIRTDLHNVSGLIQEPGKLKTAIKDMYHKYNADKEFTIVQIEDCDVENEFQKQRNYLEKTVRGLKARVAKKKDTKIDERFKVMEESAELIVETNTLRKELKVAQKQNKRMESLLGISSKYMQPREAQKRLSEAVKTRKSIHETYQEQLQVYEKTINELTEENKRLMTKLRQRIPKTSINAGRYAYEMEDEDEC